VVSEKIKVYNVRRMPSDGKSSYGLWPGELTSYSLESNNFSCSDVIAVIGWIIPPLCCNQCSSTEVITIMILDRSHERPLMWMGCWSSNNPRPRSKHRCHLMLLSWTWMRWWPTNNRRYRFRCRCYIVVSCWTMMMFCVKSCLSKWIIYTCILFIYDW
jgi:hypothetical protein